MDAVRDDDVSPRALLRDFMGLMHQQRLVLQRAFAKEDVPPGQAHCMGVLSQVDEIGQSALAEIMTLTRPSITRLLQRMERSGLVWRRTDETDQRLTLVGLTAEGRRQSARLDAVLTEYMRATLGRFPEGDRRELGRLLRTWRELADESLARAAYPDRTFDPDDAPPCSPRGSTG